MGLSESLAQYETGIGYLKYCYGQLREAERRIELLSGVDEDGVAASPAVCGGGDDVGAEAGRAWAPPFAAAGLIGRSCAEPGSEDEPIDDRGSLF